MSTSEKPVSQKPSRDAEEVREILKAVSEFIGSLRGPIKEILDMLINAVDGRRLGEEVATFYRQLKDQGVPDEVAVELTKEFFHKKMEAMPSIGALADAISGAIGGGFKPGVIVAGTKNIDEAIKVLEEIKEVSPEKKEKIEKALKMLKAMKKTRAIEREREEEEEEREEEEED